MKRKKTTKNDMELEEEKEKEGERGGGGGECRRNDGKTRKPEGKQELMRGYEIESKEMMRGDEWKSRGAG